MRNSAVFGILMIRELLLINSNHTDKVFMRDFENFYDFLNLHLLKFIEPLNLTNRDFLANITL